MVLQQGKEKGGEVRPQVTAAAKKQSTSPGTPLNIAPAKFCKRERGGFCPGNCNACLMQYLFGQYH